MGPPCFRKWFLAHENLNYTFLPCLLNDSCTKWICTHQNRLFSNLFAQQPEIKKLMSDIQSLLSLLRFEDGILGCLRPGICRLSSVIILRASNIDYLKFSLWKEPSSPYIRRSSWRPRKEPSSPYVRGSSWRPRKTWPTSCPVRYRLRIRAKVIFFKDTASLFWSTLYNKGCKKRNTGLPIKD